MSRGQVKVIRSLAELREVVRGLRQSGNRIGLVPTMGALHEGHLALVRMANAMSDRTVVSIFVNPTQFAPNEDFARYPRDEAGDLEKLAAIGCDLVWMPDVAEMYPAGFATSIVPKGPAEGLESDHRRASSPALPRSARSVHVSRIRGFWRRTTSAMSSVRS